jgi:glutamyl-tRNA synthetase
MEWFDLDAIGKAPARFDFAKLQNLNGHYIRQTDDEELLRRLEAVLPEIEGGPELAARLDGEAKERLRQLMPRLKERAKTLVELAHAARFIVADRPLSLEPKAADLLDKEARAQLGRLATALRDIEWSPERIEAAVRSFASAEGVKLGQVAQPLRAAVTGATASPGIFDVLAVLGRTESLARIADQAR